MRSLLALVLLAGCAPAAVYKPVPVELPVAAACAQPIPEAPDWPTRHLAATAALADKTKAILADADYAQAYQLQLLAALKACE